MPKLPRVNSKQMLKALKKAGFLEEHQTGSHLILFQDGAGIVTLPMHNKDLKVGTIKSILRQAQLSTDQFIEFLS